eukprot:UN32281
MVLSSKKKQKILNTRAVLCGTARNIEKLFTTIFPKLEEIGDLFQSYQIIIFESDSTDRTLSLLKGYKRMRETELMIRSDTLDDMVILHDTLLPKLKFRTHRISHGRNEIIKYIENNKLYENYDYYINLDLDDVNINLDVNNV